MGPSCARKPVLCHRSKAEAIADVAQGSWTRPLPVLGTPFIMMGWTMSHGWRRHMLLAEQKVTPFADGNKRSAFMAVGFFLGLIGWELDTGPAEAIQAVVALARSEIGEQEFAAWLRLPIKNVQA